MNIGTIPRFSTGNKMDNCKSHRIIQYPVYSLLNKTTQSSFDFNQPTESNEEQQ